MRHLGTLIVSDARMDVVRARDAEVEHIGFGIDEPLAHAAPMGEIAGQSQLRQGQQNIAGNPRMKQPSELRWVSKLTTTLPSASAISTAAPRKSVLMAIGQASQPAMTVRKRGAHSKASSTCCRKDARCRATEAFRSGT